VQNEVGPPQVPDHFFRQDASATRDVGVSEDYC
jgi:hypothetical protein